MNFKTFGRRPILGAVAALTAIVAAGLSPIAYAASAGPLTIVVPYPPGGSTDNSARILQKAIAPMLDRTVIVENRHGAAGNIGAAHVAGAPAGTDRILLATQPIITLNPHLYETLPFDPLTDLKPIVNGYSGVVAVAVHPSLPVENMAELIAYAKAHPDALNYGTSGAGSGQHVMMVRLAGQEGLEMTHVPYKGGGPMTTDLVAGHIQVGVGTLSAMQPFIEAGTVRVLALTEPERFLGAPDVPTVAETLPGVSLVPWMGFFAPASMPDEQVQAISRAMQEALQLPEIKVPLENMGLRVLGDGPEAFAADIAREYEQYGKVIRDHQIALF